MWCKHCNFNTSLNAPLIIKAPGIKGGRECNNITEFIDIYPTLCELTGLPLPDHLEGESLIKRLKKPGRKEKDYAVCKFNNGLTLIDGSMFLTEWYNKRDSVIANMLYDHVSDPGENTNLSKDQDYLQLVTSLSKTLKEKRGPAFLTQLK